jgi:hypothetical protein
MEKLDIRHEPGWYGAFTRQQAPEALFKNEQRIKKALGEPGDGTPIGTIGTILGSLYAPELGVVYFVEWNNRPRVAVSVVAWKITSVI